MKGLKKFVAATVAFGVVGVGSAFAATLTTPAEITSQLTGRTIAELTQERATGKTYGTIASEAGKLDEFKSQMLEQKKTILEQRVAEGRLTQQRADEIYSAMKNNQAACDGTRNEGIGRKYGAGFGQGSGMGAGQMSKGAGMRNGSGTGGCMGFGRGVNK